MVILAQGEQRTVTVDQMIQLYTQGVVTDASYVWRDGQGDWQPLEAVAELKALMPSHDEPEEVSAHELPQEMDDSLPTTMLASAAAAPPPAPRAAAGGFGGPRPAPAPAPVTNPAPPPARQAPPPNPVAPMPSAEPSVMAARRSRGDRPDLLEASIQSDRGLAQAAGKSVPPPAAAPAMQNRGGQLVFPGVKTESSMINLPTNFFLAQLDSPRRKKRLFIGAGAGVVIGALAVGFIIRNLDAGEKKATEDSWSALHSCLLGQPLGEREGAGDRLRSIQLTVVGLPIERRGTKAGQPAWPGRCATMAHDLAEHAKASGGPYAPIQASAEALSKALLDEASATGSFREPTEKLWADAAKASLKADKASPDNRAPKPSTALSHDAYIALPRFLSGGVAVSSIRVASPEGPATFVIDQPDLAEGPQVCVAGATGDVKCARLAAAAVKLSPGLRLLGHVEDGARPYLFAGDHGQSGILKPDGSEAAPAAYVLGSLSRKDGTLFALERSGSREAKLVTVSASGSKSDRPIARDLSGDAVASAGIASGWVAYRTGTKGAHLTLRKLPDGTGEPGPAVEAGDIEDAPAPPETGRGARRAPAAGGAEDDDRAMASCRDGETIGLRMRGTGADAVSILQAGRWSPPLKSPSVGGSFTCRKGEVVSTRVSPIIEQEKNWAAISQVRCTLAGCTPTAITMKDLLPNLLEAAPVDERAALAADLDGKLLVVWNAGYSGGIRMRLAPAAQIKDTDDTVLVDTRDPKSAQKLSIITEIKLIPAGNSALLFLGGPTGTRVFRIESSGAFSPVKAVVQ